MTTESLRLRMEAPRPEPLPDQWPPDAPSAADRLVPSPRAPGLARQIVGWSCIGLGLIGLVLPFLQGVVLLLAGAALLGPDSAVGRWVRTAVDWGRQVVQRCRERCGRKKG